ncbi:hypothetical protein Tco_0647523 [Tanacetum coccineum]
MVDVPIHQEDLAVQRTPLIEPCYLNVTKRQFNTHHHQLTQAHVQNCFKPLAGKTFQEEFRSAGWCKENSDGQKTVAEDMGFNLLVHSFRALSTLRRSGLRTASAAAKPCQGDSSEVYLITGRDTTQIDIEEILGDTTQIDIKEILRDTTQIDIKEILGDTTQIDIKDILGDTTQRDIKEILEDTTQRDIKEISGDTTQRYTSMYLGNNISG